MQKLKLDLDALRVTSFAVDDGPAGAAERGTIHANGGETPRPSAACPTIASIIVCDWTFGSEAPAEGEPEAGY